MQIINKFNRKFIRSFSRYMKKISILFVLIACVLLSCMNVNNAISSVLKYVDPFVGTTYTGHTFPGAAYPFGMMQPGPQTGNFEWEYCAGYKYEDKLIWGFSQNRLNGTGVTDMGDILIMPFSGTPRSDFKSKYSKDTEVASPGYYAVSLSDNQVDVRLTCSPRVAIHNYVFKADNPSVYIDFQSGNAGNENQYNTRVLSADIKAENNKTITGKIRVNNWVERDLCFVIQFDKPFTSADTIKGNSLNKAPKIVYHFDLGNGKELNAKVAFSLVSIEGAKNNLTAEVNHFDFDKVKEAVEAEWSRYLSRIQIEGSDEQKKNFYTSLYHLMIQPNNIADVDGKYRGPDNNIYKSESGTYYSTFSLWDTFRAAHPLYTIITPERVAGMVNSMLEHSLVQGFLPIWALWGKENYCMIGNHAVPVIVDACLKNFKGIDQEKAYQQIKTSLMKPHLNSEWDIYDQYGYFPFDLIKVESVSKTQEFSFDNYCAAQLAKKLNKTNDYHFFLNRSNYYKNLFDAQTKLIRGKDSKGKWRTPFDKLTISHASTIGGDFTEGNAWQYTWQVQHDMKGLMELMGGKDAFLTKLDSLFAMASNVKGEGFVGDVTGLIGQYAHGNEPCHHVAYFYSLAGKQWRTEEIIRQIFDLFYKPKPDGLCGNDDCGQMSAWYIFSALGFYPVNPVSGEYVLGAPQIPKATIQLPGNKKFTMIAKNISKENKYVQSVKLNGVDIKNQVITHGQIVNGGILEFMMTNKPRK